MRVTLLLLPIVFASSTALAQADGLGSPAPDAPAPAAPAISSDPLASPIVSACVEGRVATAATDGRCCWPGQTFSVERARCEGAPVCPGGSIAHGDECIASAVAPLPAPTPTQQIVASSSWGAPEALSTEEVLAIRHDLVAIGTTFFLIGWTAAVSFGFTFGACDASFAIWAAPIVGPLVATGVRECYGPSAVDWTIAVGITAFEIAGFVTWLVGLIDRRPITRTVALELGPEPMLRF